MGAGPRLLKSRVLELWDAPSDVRALYDWRSKARWPQRGTSRNGLRWQAEYNQQSGRSDTLFANSLVNGIVSYGSWRAVGANINALVVGDDLLGVVDDITALPRFSAYVGELGLSIPCAAVERERARYCSGMFWRTTSGYRHGPLIGRAVLKMAWRVLPGEVNSRSQLRWLRAVSDGWQSAYNHVPLLRDVVSRTRYLTRGIRPAKLAREFVLHSSGHTVKPSGTADVDLAYRYEVPVRWIGEARCEVYEAKLGDRLSHPIWDAMLAVDLA
jgi:hypothetical protein